MIISSYKMINMNLQEQTKRIKEMMGLNENVFLRRRINTEALDSIFNEELSQWISNVKEDMRGRNVRRSFSKQFDNGEVTPPVFAMMIHAVILRTIDAIHPELISGREDFPYDEIFQALIDRYSNQMEQAYNDNFGRLQ